MNRNVASNSSEAAWCNNGHQHVGLELQIPGLEALIQPSIQWMTLGPFLTSPPHTTGFEFSLLRRKGKEGSTLCTMAGAIIIRHVKDLCEKNPSLFKQHKESVSHSLSVPPHTSLPGSPALLTGLTACCWENKQGRKKRQAKRNNNNNNNNSSKADSLLFFPHLTFLTQW